MRTPRDADVRDTAVITVKRSPWRWLQWTLVPLALVFAGIALARQWTALRETAAELRPNWAQLGVASAIVLGTYGILVASWRLLVRGFGSDLHYLTAVRIWVVSNLGRYIPGTLWSVVGMGIMAEQVGVQPAAAAGSAIIGTLINIGAGFGVVALSGSAVLDGVSPTLRTVALVGAAAFVLGVAGAPWLLPLATRFLARTFARVVPERALPAGTLWAAVTLNVISWFGYGWAFMVFCHAFIPHLVGSLPQFIAVWTAAYVAGFLLLIMPAGFGVREGVLVALMVALGLSSQAEATLLSLASRVWLTILELLPGLIGLAVSPLALRRRGSVSR
jgi:hypothetical protein